MVTGVVLLLLLLLLLLHAAYTGENDSKSYLLVLLGRHTYTVWHAGENTTHTPHQ